MSSDSRLMQVYKAANEVHLDNHSRFVFFSDCHRGDDSQADNFARNQDIYLSALIYYYNRNYTYVEIGDGDELWENDRFSTIFQAHRDVFLFLQKFHREGRLYMIWGNHDIVKRRKRFVQNHLYQYYNPLSKKFEPLFEDIQLHEGLILRYLTPEQKIFVVHGHQGDLINDRLWPLGRFLVRYVWRHIELLRRRNPISPARNDARLILVESNFTHWIRENQSMLIAGHTHRREFARPGEIPYFNDGCCVYKGYITGIEIQNGEIALVKWSRKIGEQGITAISREVIGGPERISQYFDVGFREMPMRHSLPIGGYYRDR